MPNDYTIPKLLMEDLIRENYLIVDVRSPKEFEEFFYPNSINIPLFDNDERAKVGTIYKQQGRDIAVKIGLEIFSKKIPFIYDQVLEHLASTNKELVFICARGGMRSSSLVSTFNMLGVKCYQLEGGIRSYRQQVVEKLQQFAKVPNRFIVVSGNTGTKKTDVLIELRNEGYPVIDLEGLANHRGSVFGGIGLKERTQKQFDALLVDELQRYKNFGYYIIESESKRIGNIVIPDFILQGKERAVRVELKHPMVDRVKHIVATYNPSKNHQEIIEAFQKIKKRFKDQDRIDIENALTNFDFNQAFELLLIKYYDPMYQHAFKQYLVPIYPIEFKELSEAVTGVKEVIKQLYPEYYKEKISVN